MTVGAEMEVMPDWLQAALSGLGGAVLSWLGFRRKYSQDTNAMERDRAETAAKSELLAILQTERNLAKADAEEARAMRVEDVKRIAYLEGQLEANGRETARLRDELFSMRLHTRKLTAIIVKLDPAAAQLLNIDSYGDGIETEGLLK